MGGIREWLEQRGLGEFAQAFESERVDLEALPELTDADLKELGLPLGPRRKLLKAIRALAGDLAPAGHATVPPDPGAGTPGQPLSGEAERRQIRGARAECT